MTERLITTNELADFLGVPVATLHRWSYLNQGPPRMRVGRHLRYRREEVDRWLLGQSEGPGTTRDKAHRGRAR